MLADAISADHSQTHEMKRQRGFMRLQWKAMQDQIVEIGSQTRVLRDSVEVSKTSADAAKASADIAVGVSAPGDQLVFGTG